MKTMSSVEYLALGKERFAEVSEEKKSRCRQNGETVYPVTLGTWEVASVIRNTNNDLRANRKFLRETKSILNSFGFSHIWSFESAKKCSYEEPWVYSNRWENFAVNNDESTKNRQEYFNLFDPSGRFYHIRSSDDDVFFDSKSNGPNECFDIHLPVVHSLQAISAILKLSEMFTVDEDDRIDMVFRWGGLRNRTLSSWLCSESFFCLNGKSYQDEIEVKFSITKVDRLSELYPLVLSRLQPLYNLFEGFELDSERFDSALEYFESRSR